jgi:hypothetical protein
MNDYILGLIILQVFFLPFVVYIIIEKINEYKNKNIDQEDEDVEGKPDENFLFYVESGKYVVIISYILITSGLLKKNIF